MPYATNGGVRIHYQEQGQGEPLVLIMGLGAPLERWELHARAYAEHFRCLLVDNRGAGRSDTPAGPYTTREMAGDVAAVLDAAGVESAHVAGISMGSAIAQELALTRPQRVRRLVLISSWARCDRYTAAVFEHFARVRAVARPAEFVQLLQLWIFSPGHYESHYEEMLEGQASAADGYMPLDAFVAQCSACSTHDTLARLGEIRAPALLTVGSADIFTPPRLSVEMHERLPDSRMLVFPDLGHAHHWEDLQRFNDETIRFLQGV